MRGKMILLTGIVALGLAACGTQGNDPAGESMTFTEPMATGEAAREETTGMAEAAREETTGIAEADREETTGIGEAAREETTETADAEAVSENTTAAAETGEPGETAEISWEDYGECSDVEKDFFNDNGEKTYYYHLDEFYFYDEKYVKVNDYLEQMYQQYCGEYEEEGEKHTGDFERFDAISEESLPEELQYDYNRLVFNCIAFIDDNYVSMRFNDTIYWEGSAHPQSYYAPVTISVETGEEITPEEILGKTWEEIRTVGGIEEESEATFNKDYGFYLTDTELHYVYRYNYFVDEIRIPR